MDTEAIRRRKAEITDKFGPWTNHNIRLCEDIYTIDKGALWSGQVLRRIIQILSDVASEPLENLRVLDLGCLEGLFAIELSRHGAKVVAIEGREANIEKTRFAKDIIGLDNLQLSLDDVRNLSEEKYGRFDVVLCLGILYHLDVPDVFSFVERMAQVCQRFAIIDTHVSIAPQKSYIYNGQRYWGSKFQEHSSGTTPEERDKALWSSLDNVTSFWFTRASLFNLLSHVGFTSIYECPALPGLKQPYDRITLLAIKGSLQTIISSPLTPEMNWTERPRYLSTLTKMLVKSGQLLPRQVRKIGKRMLQ